MYYMTFVLKIILLFIVCFTFNVYNNTSSLSCNLGWFYAVRPIFNDKTLDMYSVYINFL